MDRAQSASGKPPSSVFDINGTALSNGEIIKAGGFSRVINSRCIAVPEGPCSQTARDLLARASVIAPILPLLQQSRALNIAAFFTAGDLSRNAVPLSRTCAVRYMGLYQARQTGDLNRLQGGCHVVDSKRRHSA